MTTEQRARQVMHRADLLGTVTDEPGRLTRLSWSPAMRRANDQVARWMREAGMTVRQDAIGNLIGRSPRQHPKSPSLQHSKVFLIGSHLDTVRDAGKYDGILGVLVGIACVEQLRHERRKLPFQIEVIGFADEEGVHFQSAYLGSGALTGSTTAADLKRTDEAGTSLGDAIRQFGGDPSRLASARRSGSDLFGYAEVHIEQGPVLERAGLSLGVVSHIVGITRAQVVFQGRAGHAGTTPMDMRSDALCAAAEFVIAVEDYARRHKDLVATVGQLAVVPGAVNVIPGNTTLTLDLRHADDGQRRAASVDLRHIARKIATKRKVRATWRSRAETRATRLALAGRMTEAAKRHQSNIPTIISGAGHDAAEMARITPATMLFVRCKGGVSHNPAESVRPGDVALAIATLCDFVTLCAERSRA